MKRVLASLLFGASRAASVFICLYLVAWIVAPKFLGMVFISAGAITTIWVATSIVGFIQSCVAFVRYGSSEKVYDYRKH